MVWGIFHGANVARRHSPMIAKRTVRVLLTFLMAAMVLMPACGLGKCNLRTSVSPDGSGTVTPAGGAYEEGVEVTISAAPAEGYAFDHWDGDVAGTSDSISVIMDADKAVTAHFVTAYNLSTSVSPSGGGTVTPASGTYEKGTEVTLTAEAAPGYHFDHWSGVVTSSSPEVSIFMYGDNSVTAHFVKTYDLSISVHPSNGGTVTPASGAYDAGTEVRLIAHPAPGYRFDYWRGDATGTSPSITLNMNGGKIVSAFFAYVEQYLGGSYAIEDRAFEPVVEGDCGCDIEILSVDGESFVLVKGTLSIVGGEVTLWCYGAKHTWVGCISYAGYTFDSDADNPLQFMVDREKGYLHIRGKGTVTQPDGEVVSLP
jgi:major membrane immunogen (membrane-anchored lipoprotein)